MTRLVRLASLLFGGLQLASASPWPQLQKRAQNPSNYVIKESFPSPGIILVGDDYYAFSTSVGGVNIPKATTPKSSFTSQWSLVKNLADGTTDDALPVRPEWVTQDQSMGLWAPDVVQIGSQFVMYFCGIPSKDDPSSGRTRRCIGAATSSDINGPFTAHGKDFLICEKNRQGGDIDPNAFKDPKSGNLYLVHKRKKSLDTAEIVLTRLSEDGLEKMDDGITLARAQGSSDGGDVEGPALVYSEEQDQYVLFFNTQNFQSPAYTTRVATSKNLVRADKSLWPRQQAPFLSTQIIKERGIDAYAPGGVDVVPEYPQNFTWYAFDNLPNGGQKKRMHVGKIRYDSDGTVSLAGADAL